MSLFSPEGDAIRTFSLPPTFFWSWPEIAYDGKRVVVAGARTVVLFEVSGEPVGQFTPARDNNQETWTPFLTPDGDGLLLFDGIRTLHRYELP